MEMSEKFVPIATGICFVFGGEPRSKNDTSALENSKLLVIITSKSK